MVNWRRYILCGCLLLGGGMSRPAAAETVPFREYEVKAAFLFNFAQFIEWPAQAFTNAATPFVIGVVGDISDNRFGHVLNQIMQGETIAGRRILLKFPRQFEELAGCQILFIGRSEQARLPQILSLVNRAGVLTVGETDSFTRLGGIINFITRDNKVRFELHLDNAARAGLKVDAKLLKVAQVVAAPNRAEER